MTVRPREITPALLQVDAVLDRLRGKEALSEVCRFLRSAFPHFQWVGVYRLDGEFLVLEGWDGEAPTEHARIPLDQGICGRAARENRTVIVEDVRAAPEYLACFLDTRSEIVVPIRDEDKVLGEVDVDGRSVGAFDATDDRFLGEVARRLTPVLQLISGGAALPIAGSAASSTGRP